MTMCVFIEDKDKRRGIPCGCPSPKRKGIKMKKRRFIAVGASIFFLTCAPFCLKAEEAVKEIPKEVSKEDPGSIGRASLPDSSEYEGEFKNGKFHGKGRLVWRNGSRYSGEFNEGLMEGAGVYLEKDGAKYEGEFRGGLPHGRGVYSFGNGDVYEGDMKNGGPNGCGVISFSSGDKYEGEFKNGKFHGEGKYTHVKDDGEIMEMDGYWEKGDFTG